MGSISLSSAAEARSYLNTMTMRQKYLTLGAFCAAYCRVVSVHHAIEDQQLFRDLKDADELLGPILERLQDEREGIAKVLGEVDGALVAMVEDEPAPRRNAVRGRPSQRRVACPPEVRGGAVVGTNRAAGDPGVASRGITFTNYAKIKQAKKLCLRHSNCEQRDPWLRCPRQFVKERCNMSKRVSLGVALGAVLALVGGVLSGSAGDLTLHPSGFGPHSYAAWKAQQGNPADPDAATSNQALYFQKMVPTATFAAGVAVVNGVAGMPASELTSLSWQHRTDGHCGAGAPRWNIGVDGLDGVHYTLFLGCSAATHTLAGTSWCQDSYGGATILALGASNAGLSANIGAIQAGTITSLALVFDEGTDNPGNPVPECADPGGAAGFVFLDNVTVNETTWSSASDNGNG